MSNNLEVKVPDIGDITDAEIIEVSVAVGDEVDVEDALIVLETDKASMDVPSPAAGTVASIACEVGEKVGEGHLILSLTQSAEASEEAPTEPEPEAEAAPEPEAAPAAEEPEATPEPVAAEAVTSVQTLVVPDIGQDEPADVIEVMIAEGDEIEVDQELAVLESEKASMEVPASHAGKIIKVFAKVGDKLGTGDAIAEAEVVTQAAVPAKAEPAPAPKAETTSAPKTAAPAPTPVADKSRPPVPDYPAISSGPNKGAVYASPAIRRFARELGADLTKVKGSGTKGRIIKEDVQQFIKDELARPKATANTGMGSDPVFPEIDFSKFGDVEEMPLTKIQKVSAVNLRRNWSAIPHVTQHEQADITEMEAFRKAMKDEALNDGVRLTPLAFMMKAVVASLKAFPRFNASLANDGENLILKKYYHIGVAVDTPEGLVVPVIRDVDQKSIYDLARELGEVSVKARDRKLGMDAMQGGCFSISSLGGIGGTSFTPIVNWPDVAILGVSKSEMKPVWNGSEFVPRLMLPLSLSYDHRVIDGALAAKFTSHLAIQLTDIRRLLLK